MKTLRISLFYMGYPLRYFMAGLVWVMMALMGQSEQDLKEVKNNILGRKNGDKNEIQ